ncbi:ABC transporter permease [Methanobacterium sp. CWC-01]|uniref:ABC transporter permease n=1 Tax=Methanobacterium aridiramus TaxID=2584467 RepID=UPI002574B7F8|nr:ABC transporter permease [Methanobacterium sp. CWC-01]WJI09551.1 ABC transporter permease [Methanobacterium sp. CWC-01]
MKLTALVKKEAHDILGNRIFLLVVLVQLLIILGTFGLAISTALVNDPAVIDSYGVNSAFKVGLSEDLNQSTLVDDLEAQKLQLEYFNTTLEAKKFLGTDLVAVIGMSPQGEVQVELDTSNVFYPVASTKISKAVDTFQIQRSLQSLELSEEQINAIQEPVKLRVVNLEEDEAVNIALDSPYFVEVMYGFIVPFILLLPFFMASNLVTDSIVGEKERKTFEVLLMAPLSSSTVVMGKIIPILSFSLLQSLAWILLLDLLQVPIFNTILMLLILFFLGLGFIGVGILISILVDSTKEANSAITLILVFATFILFVPLFVKSGMFQVLFNFIPTVLMVKIASRPVISPEIILFLVPTILISILMFMVTVKSFRHERAIRL